MKNVGIMPPIWNAPRTWLCRITVERVFFRKRAIFGILLICISLIFGIWWIITNSNKSKFSRKANVQILSMSTQCPQLVCKIVLVLSLRQRKHVMVSLRMGTWLVCHAVRICNHCKTFFGKISEDFNFRNCFEHSENSEKYPLLINTRSTVWHFLKDQ